MYNEKRDNNLCVYVVGCVCVCNSRDVYGKGLYPRIDDVCGCICKSETFIQFAKKKAWNDVRLCASSSLYFLCVCVYVTPMERHSFLCFDYYVQ